MNYYSSLNKILNHPLNKYNFFGTICRLVWWKINQLFFNLPVIYQLTNSTKIICEPTSSYGSYIVYAKYPEYDEMNFIHSYLKKDDTFIDVGANIGAVTLLAADKITSGMIYAFEPTPSISNKCTTNIRLNKLENRVTCFTKAVSNKSGTLQFTIEPSSEVNHISSGVKKGGSSDITVESITIDSFLVENKISRVNLLKVDVEGAELSVFQGATKALHGQRIDVVVFEVNAKMSQFDTTPRQLLSFLKKCKYKIYSITEDGQLRKFKDTDYVSETINLVAVSQASRTKSRVAAFISRYV